MTRILEAEEIEMDEDLNTSGALNVLWKLMKDKDAEGKYQTIKKIDEVLGLKLLEKEEMKIPKEVEELAEKRELARKEKDWVLADELRDKIKELGYQIKDSKEGFDITKI